MDSKNKSLNFNWCYEIGEIVNGYFFEDDDDNELKDTDEFIIEERDIDEEREQWYIVKCKRNGEKYEVHSSLLEKK